MLPRTLEPEVMDTADDAADYDAMDHSQVNRAFVDDLLAAWNARPHETDGPVRIFDAGTGTARIPIELLSREIAAHVVAADAAASMLELARRNVERAGFADRIEPVLRDCKALPETDGWFDIVMSNSIVHHIPEPVAVLAECWRVLRSGGLLFVRDLFRPDDETTLNQLVQQYAGGDNPHQRQLFRESLHAALTVEELRDLLRPLGIDTNAVQATSDRHWTLVAWK